MKLKNKLIPLLSACGATTIIAPIGLTSCGSWVRYTDILNAEYEPWVVPYKKTTVYSRKTLLTLYENRLAMNPDIIRDDMLYTWSALLHDSKSKTEIDKFIKYSAFELDLHLSKEEDIVNAQGGGITQEVVVLNVESHVAGENKGAEHLVDAKGNLIANFDFTFDVSIHGIQGVEYTDTSVYPVPEKFAKMHVLAIGFQGGYIEIDLSGTYTLDHENKTHTYDHESEYLVPDAEPTDIMTLSPLYRMFGLSTLALPQHAAPQQTNMNVISASSNFHIFSHYLKNVTLVPEE